MTSDRNDNSFILRFSIFTGFSAELFSGTLTVLNSGRCAYHLRWLDPRMTHAYANGETDLSDDLLTKVLELTTEIDPSHLKPFYPSTLDDGGGCRFEFSSADHQAIRIDINYPNALDANNAERLLNSIRLALLDQATEIKNRVS